MLFRSRRNSRAASRQQYGWLSFRCNICGAPCATPTDELGREVVSCQCGSTVRWRSLIHVLSLELFGESLALPDFPVRREISGLGMSDWEGYAAGLARKFDYRNTHYHQEPRLDITDIPEELASSMDFIISSDVFEHVPPPVSVAFRNARRMLKPGGVLVFTAPYSQEEKTLEHFPELYDYHLAESEGVMVLHNRTRSGEAQTFRDLVFHGGAGQTLEMRVFSESSLMEEFERAGFREVRIYREPAFEHGIYWSEDWSLPMSARVILS